MIVQICIITQGCPLSVEQIQEIILLVPMEKALKVVQAREDTPLQQ